jgi:TolA-binding protein
MRPVAVLVALTAWCAPVAAQPAAKTAPTTQSATKTAPAATGQARFDAATQLEARGQFRDAADALEKLGHDAPADSFAADALYEAAVVREERLADPARAATLYEEVATRYPQSRLARRARTRADFLRASLTTGEAPLREYESIMNGVGERDKRPSIARMEQLLAEHPDFALADRALFWLANSYAQRRDDKHALALYERLESQFPTSEWAERARKAHGDLLLAHGHPFAARALYRQLAESPDPLARSAAREGLADARSYLARAIVSIVAALFLLGFVGLNLRAARKTLRIPPFEAFYYIPVAGVFVVAAATENRMIGWATSAIAVGGALIVWLSASASSARLARGPMSMRERLWRAALCALAVLALTWLAIALTGLADIVVETFRTGPERG